MSASDERSTLSILLIRIFLFVLVAAVLGVWMLYGMQLEATQEWLTVEVAVAVSGGALVVWFLAALIWKAAGERSGLRPPEPRE